MPILSPSGVLQFLISDLENEVLLRTENRTTDAARADIWLRDALLEIASNPDFRDDFDQLEQFGPVFNLTAKTQEYNQSNIVPTGDYNDAMLDILLWQDPPTNNIRRKLDPSHYQKADYFQPTFSLPTEWYRFGESIGFTPIPDKAYQVQARMLKQHPINDNVLNQTAILLPRDWNEILIWSAVERGFAELLEYEKAAHVHAILHGDLKHPERPGLISGRKKRREREAWRQEAALRPVVRPMTKGCR